MRVRRVTQKDIETLQAILEIGDTSTGGYATHRQLAAHFNLSPKAITDRIARLKAHGLLFDEHRWGKRITAEGYAALKRVGRDERTGKLYARVEITKTGG